MTVSRGLWVPLNTGNVGTTPVEGRRADAGLFVEDGPGIPRSGLLYAPTLVVTGTGTMDYAIAPCKPVKHRTIDEGVYRWSIDGVTTVPTIAAPGANSRIDIIWTKQNDHSKGDPDNLAYVGVSQGVAAPVPGAPAIPDGALELARAVVSSTNTSTAQASITQTYRHTALRGNPVPVRNTTERAEITPGPRAQVLRLDLVPPAVDEWSGTAWRETPEPRGVIYEFEDATGPDEGPYTAQMIVASINNVVFKAGRQYEIRLTHNWYASNVDTVILQAICLTATTDSPTAITGLGTPLKKCDYGVRSPNRAYDGSIWYTYKPSADTTRQVKISATRIEGTGNFSFQRHPETPLQLEIIDKGAY